VKCIRARRPESIETEAQESRLCSHLCRALVAHQQSNRRQQLDEGRLLFTPKSIYVSRKLVKIRCVDGPSRLGQEHSHSVIDGMCILPSRRTRYHGASFLCRLLWADGCKGCERGASWIGSGLYECDREPSTKLVSCSSQTSKRRSCSCMDGTLLTRKEYSDGFISNRPQVCPLWTRGRIICGFHGNLEPPIKNEKKYYHAIHKIGSESDFAALVSMWGLAV